MQLELRWTGVVVRVVSVGPELLRLGIGGVFTEILRLVEFDKLSIERESVILDQVVARVGVGVSPVEVYVAVSSCLRTLASTAWKKSLRWFGLQYLIDRWD